MNDPDLVVYDRELDDAFDVIEGLTVYATGRTEDGDPILYFWKPGRTPAKLVISTDAGDGAVSLRAVAER